MSIRNFDALFDPRSIALVGASNEPRSVGSVIAENLLAGGFPGPVMTVNPHETAIRSAVNYKSIAELPAVPDLAVIATPAATVPGVVAELGQRGCRAAVVVSAGLRATGRGQDLRQRVLDAAKPSLVRVVGPNSVGLISPGKGINASFAPLMLRKGEIGLVSQSGAIVTAMLDWAQERGIGFSHVLSLGDMSDVDFGDLLDFLSLDRATRSILLYVENVTHAKKFMSAARIAARAKPVVVVKGGRSAGGAKASHSHTGALAGSDAVYDAAFCRAGVLRVRELEELFAAATTLATGMRVTGDRLAVMTNGGAVGVLAADALDAFKGRLAPLGEETLARLDAVLPADWSRGNPVDMLGDASAERYAATLEALMRAPESDAVMVIYCPTAAADGFEVAQAVAEAASARPRFPLLANWLGGAAAGEACALFAARKIPTFSSPARAVRAFTHLARYRRNQALLLETPSAGTTIAGERIEDGRRLIGEVLAAQRSALTEVESKRLLSLFGIPTVETLFAPSPDAAAARAADIGGPVALKIVAPDLTHKSDLGGVKLSLRSPAEVGQAARDMLAGVRARAPGIGVSGFTVQPMVVRPDAFELIAGIAADETFGPVLLFGRGGKATEVIPDTAIGLPPLNSVLARAMIERTRISRALAGFRDVPPVRREAVVDVLVRLSELAVHLPEVMELDINPLLADETGVIALDARVVLRGTQADGVGLAIRPYPRELEREAVLPDGQRFLLRPIRPEDEIPLAAMAQRCTPNDLRLRFFAPLKSFPHEMAARFSQIDYDREMALVAVEEGSAYGAGPIFGVVRLVGDPENETAEFAVIVRSDMKGRGLGYCLMSEILGYARRRGLKRVYGDVLIENRTMLQMARDLGFSTQIDPQAGAVRVSIAFPA